MNILEADPELRGTGGKGAWLLHTPRLQQLTSDLELQSKRLEQLLTDTTRC